MSRGASGIPTPEERDVLGLAGGSDVQLYRAKRCSTCDQTGYAGRVALYELMPVEGNVRRVINSSTEEIFAAPREQGMTTIREEGIRLCLEGMSSFDEIRRVTGDRLS